ncbi:hypothetical protein [Mesorhizobium wenxiniae]|nr:hypothetical protein [Mesorhizobium wenxiniae]
MQALLFGEFAYGLRHAVHLHDPEHGDHCAAGRVTTHDSGTP